MVYQLAVKMYGEETAKGLFQYAVDHEDNYISKSLNANVTIHNGIAVCNRCGGKAMWGPEHLKVSLCLRCYDDWDLVSTDLLEKHGYVSSRKKWYAAFSEFCEARESKKEL